MNRRELFKTGAAVLSLQALTRNKAHANLVDPPELYPVSPFIVNPFTDPLPVPLPIKPVDPYTHPSFKKTPCVPSAHQVWPGSGNTMKAPVYYHIPVQVSTHSFTSSDVQPLDKSGDYTSWNGRTHLKLPNSMIYGFNGTFPGPLINARYWQPAMVRFDNQLDNNPTGLSRGDFGVTSFLTHLHNGHTAPESDGNPNHTYHAGSEQGGHGVDYHPGTVLDNMYLNWPAGGDERECQSFLWFHDHQHSHTGENVYKGMVGLYCMYYHNDNGDERTGYRLPGVPDPTTGQVKYDIPLALYDVNLDDGNTAHNDFYQQELVAKAIAEGKTPPDTGTWPHNWGHHFFRHYSDKGFVGDIFTVNGKAYPVLEVFRRKYRFRFLGASISRCYQLSIMRTASALDAPVPSPGMQGQWLLPTGSMAMRMVQVAAEGGLLPNPVVRESFELWPGKRREFVVDFTKYHDGSPVKLGDVVYLVNTMTMTDGLKPDSYDPAYKVPVMKIKIVADPPEQDYSLVLSRLRPIPPLPAESHLQSLIANPLRIKLEKGSRGWDAWRINGTSWVPGASDYTFPMNSDVVMEIQTGKGWVHPMHFHQEEHRIIGRKDPVTGNMVRTDQTRDDLCKEDVVPLGAEGRVWIYRKFRTFRGHYVAHCHNLAHEDHAMMFGFKIV